MSWLRNLFKRARQRLRANSKNQDRSLGSDTLIITSKPNDLSVVPNVEALTPPSKSQPGANEETLDYAPASTALSTSPPSTVVSADNSEDEHRRNSITGTGFAHVARQSVQQGLPDADQGLYNSPRESTDSHETQESSNSAELPPSEVRDEVSTGTPRSEAFLDGIANGVEHVAQTSIAPLRINIRSPTFPLEINASTGPINSFDERGPFEQPGLTARSLPFLQTNYLTIPNPLSPPSPALSATVKSDIVSLPEEVLMEEVLPHMISVTVTMTWESNADFWPPETIAEFHWLKRENYANLLPDKIISKHKEAFLELATSHIYHRYGSCRVKATSGRPVETPYKILDEADVDSFSENAMQIICLFIANNPKKPFSLEVNWDAGCAHLEPHLDNPEPFDEMIRWEIGRKMRKNFKNQEYLPRKDKNVFQQGSVVKELVLRDQSLNLPGICLTKEEKLEFANLIVTRPAVNLWIVCFYNRLDMAFLRHLLLDHQCSDDRVPRKFGQCNLATCQNRVSQLLKEISAFQVRNIDPDFSNRKLTSEEIMPIRCTEDPSALTKGLVEIGSGASSHVYKVHIDYSHHYLDGNPLCEFALKQFPSLRTVEFKREVSMLRVLADYPDPSIVLHHTSWTQDDHHYILYPKAAFNLRDFMQRYARAPLSRSGVLWFLNQLEGLASAIKHVHNLKQPTNTNRHPKAALTGCHYDIKAENILVFEQIPKHHPIFKISDFGVGVFNKAKDPGQDSELTQEAKGTRRYFAPEWDSKKVSRPFDMWALGCVFLELMVWQFGFFESSYGFSTARFDCSTANPESRHDTFYTKIADGTFDLKSVVRDALEELESKHCKKLRAFRDVIEVIRGLLRIDPKRRWSARHVKEKLGATIRQALTDLQQNPNFYHDQYAANLGGKPFEQELASERVKADQSTAGSTRSPSPSSPERQRSFDGGQRLRSETRSSQALVHTGSVTDLASNGRDLNDRLSPSDQRESEALEREMQQAAADNSAGR